MTRGGRTPAIRDEDHEDFTRRWNAGEDGASIAAAYGCSRATVSQTAARFGLPSRYRRRRRGGRTRTTDRPDPYALTGGAWVTGPDRIARWVPGAQA